MTPAHARREILRATLLVAVSACCFGSISPLTVIALKSGVALQGIQALRYATTAVLLMLYAAWRPSPVHAAAAQARGFGAAPWYSWRVLLVAGGGQASVATLALVSLRWIPASTSAFLFYTYPAWVAIMTAVRGIEPLGPGRVIALLLALGGIGAMVGAPSAASLNPTGVMVSLVAALVYAGYIPVLSALQRTRAPLDVARAISLGGAVLFLTWALSTGTLFAHHDARSMAASMLQGVLSAGAFLGFLAGLSRLGAVRTAITSTIEPFWTTLVGVLALGQGVGGGTLVGGAAIMAAVLLLQRPNVALGRLHSSSSHEGDHTGRPTP
ncbi:MAG: DMT family transporter [Gemmatimonadaceae bacterium]|nr:DMT family transporter [Gemmatimonadaceae bacterium]